MLAGGRPPPDEPGTAVYSVTVRDTGDVVGIQPRARVTGIDATMDTLVVHIPSVSCSVNTDYQARCPPGAVPGPSRRATSISSRRSVYRS